MAEVAFSIESQKAKLQFELLYNAKGLSYRKVAIFVKQILNFNVMASEEILGQSSCVRSHFKDY